MLNTPLDTALESFIRALPKVELHVHLEGSIQPKTLLALAARHGVSLPAATEPDLRTWYTFSSFENFVTVYLTISDCIRTPDDIEFLAREFLSEQAAQHILHTDVTYTAYTHYRFRGIPVMEQLQALNRARTWAEHQLGVTMAIILDIPRTIPVEDGEMIAAWAVEGQAYGVAALGLGGIEKGNPPQKYQRAFEYAHAVGLPCIPHAGETDGPQSIWDALRVTIPSRIGHGVRCLEDPSVVDELRRRQTLLEVCPTSNVCLGVVPSFAAHPLPRLLAEGLQVTLNSDDPPMFGTTLTDEYLLSAAHFGLGREEITQLVRTAIDGALLDPARKATLHDQLDTLA